MERAGIQVKQAAADADTLIVRSVIKLSPTIDVVVGRWQHHSDVPAAKHEKRHPAIGSGNHIIVQASLSSRITEADGAIR